MQGIHILDFGIGVISYALSLSLWLFIGLKSYKEYVSELEPRLSTDSPENKSALRGLPSKDIKELGELHKSKVISESKAEINSFYQYSTFFLIKKPLSTKPIILFETIVHILVAICLIYVFCIEDGLNSFEEDSDINSIIYYVPNLQISSFIRVAVLALKIIFIALIDTTFIFLYRVIILYLVGILVGILIGILWLFVKPLESSSSKDIPPTDTQKYKF